MRPIASHNIKMLTRTVTISQEIGMWNQTNENKTNGVKTNTEMYTGIISFQLQTSRIFVCN